MPTDSAEKPRTSRARRVGFATFLVVAGLIIGALIWEGLLRTHRIAPVRQIVRENDVRDVNGVAVWGPGTIPPSGRTRAHLECVAEHPERRRILFFGNSITYGAGVDGNETFASLLEARLNASHPSPGFCVMNFAVPAFRWAQKFAMASDTIPRYRPAMALYQDWDGEWGGVGCPSEYPREYTRLGDAVFGVMGLRVRDDGLPGMAGVPDGLNHWLFSHSYLYQYVTLAKGEGNPGPPMCPPGHEADFRIQSLRKFVALARSAGAIPVIFIAADLTYPMNETHPRELAEEQPLFDMGKTDGVRVIRLRDLLTDQDNAAIRLDSWHFNPAGHKVLAEKLEPIVLDGVGQSQH